MILSFSPSSSSSSSIRQISSRTRTKRTSRSFIAEVLACILGLVGFLNAVTAATNELSEGEIEGRDLARQILEERPSENFTNNGVIKIRDGHGKRTAFSVRCEVIITPTNWQSIYETVVTNSDGYTDGDCLKIVHADYQPDEYTWNNYTYQSARINPLRSDLGGGEWSGTKWICPFSQSDFWAVDLGLEFFHWPAQKVLKHEMKRGQACKVLESTNPEPSLNGYSRVVSWIDNDSGGIVQAAAYDTKGKLLKEFAPKEFKKVNGQWQLQEMEIRNVQTGSRTRLEFNLDKK